VKLADVEHPTRAEIPLKEDPAKIRLRQNSRLHVKLFASVQPGFDKKASPHNVLVLRWISNRNHPNPS
jgi:hypothetical protein